MAALEFQDLVTVGRVVKPQGRKGEVAVASLTDRPDRFSALRRVYIPGPGGSVEELEVASYWPHKGRVVLKFVGVDSIDEAERLRGMDLRIPEGDLEALPEGSFYYHQLRGLRVEDESGRAIGEVADILRTGGAADVLVVRGPGGESLLPLVGSFVKKVDLGEGRLVAAPLAFFDAAR